MEVIGAGINVSSANGTITFRHPADLVANYLCLRVHSGTTCTLMLDSDTTKTIICGTVDHYDTIPLSCQSITVISGFLDYIALAGDL